MCLYRHVPVLSRYFILDQLEERAGGGRLGGRTHRVDLPGRKQMTVRDFWNSGASGLRIAPPVDGYFTHERLDYLFMSTMNSDRPISLPLLGGVRLPLAAIASITHRITGVLLFAGIALSLYLLDMALESPEGFAAAGALVHGGGWITFLVWAALVALLYHIYAGIKHLLLDLHIGDNVKAAFWGSIVVILLTAVDAVLLGMWLW